MRSPAPMISIILPCYRAANTARRSVDLLRSHMGAFLEPYEIILVDDGGHDFVDREFATDPVVRLIRFPRNRGKGAALRTGLTEARGRVRIFTDVDLPYGIDILPLLVHVIDRGFHVALGDRTLAASNLPPLELPLSRRLLSAVASQVIGRVVTGGFHDTQCGVKAIRGDVADLLLPLTRIDRFAFDVEFVYLCLYHRLDIKRIPVTLQPSKDSTVRPIRDAIAATVDIMGIKLRQLQSKYESTGIQLMHENETRQLVTASRSRLYDLA